MFMPFAGASLLSGCFTAPRNTLSVSGRRRAPWHTWHFSSPKKYFVPKPLHSGQAPYGELKENNRGSISGYENPSYGHMNFDEISSSPRGLSILTKPPDS